MTEDEMVGWHHQLNGHESEQTPGVGKEEGSLLCRSPWSAKSQTRLSTEQQQSFSLILITGPGSNKKLQGDLLHPTLPQMCGGNPLSP